MQKLLERAARGDLRLPRFQRGLKWKLKDNLLLLDSLYRGFPIGTLLFWEKKESAARIFLGPVPIDAPESQRAWLIIDGQQRISALVGSMLRSDSAVDDFALGFDLERDRFVQLRKEVQKDPRIVPLPVLMVPERLLGWLEQTGVRGLIPDASERAFRVSTRLRDYEIAAYVVETPNEEVVREVFTRLNTGGKRLTKTEVFGAIEPEGSSHGIAQTQAALEELEFGRLDDSVVLKSLQAVIGEDITQSFRPNWSKDEREQAWTRTLEALRRAIVFLRREGEVPHVALLPYSMPVAILARFFALHPEPRPRTLTLLKRWLWRGFVHGSHQGQSIPLVRKTVAAVTDDEDRSIEQLLHLVPRDPSAPGLGGKVSLKTARTRIEVLALLRTRPRSFETGEVIDVVRVLNDVGPGRLLGELVPGRTDVVGRSIANRIVVDGSVPRKLNASADWMKEVMASHRIRMDLDKDAALDDRGEVFANYLAEVFDDWMGIGQSDRPAISSLIEAGDVDE